MTAEEVKIGGGDPFESQKLTHASSNPNLFTANRSSKPIHNRTTHNFYNNRPDSSSTGNGLNKSATTTSIFISKKTLTDRRQNSGVGLQIFKNKTLDSQMRI